MARPKEPHVGPLAVFPDALIREASIEVRSLGRKADRTLWARATGFPPNPSQEEYWAMVDDTAAAIGRYRADRALKDEGPKPHHLRAGLEELRAPLEELIAALERCDDATRSCLGEPVTWNSTVLAGVRPWRRAAKDGPPGGAVPDLETEADRILERLIAFDHAIFVRTQLLGPPRQTGPGTKQGRLLLLARLNTVFNDHRPSKPTPKRSLVDFVRAVCACDLVNEILPSNDVDLDKLIVKANSLRDQLPASLK
jgi:hypothetical protein